MSAPLCPPSHNPRVPALEVPLRHAMRAQIRFSDLDPLGHVNNNALLALFDLAKIQYLEHITQGQTTIQNIKAAVVNLNVDFYEPAYFTDNLHIYTTILRVGHRSFTIEQRAVCLRSGATKSRALTTLAGFDPATATPADIDPHIIALASAYEQRELISPTL